jgi:hypothetical protein
MKIKLEIMKVDTFTKIVLTIIALNLTFFTVKNLDIIPKAYANEPVNNFGLNPNLNYGLVPLNDDGSVTVKLSSYDEIDVNITDISTSDKLNVVVKEVDTYAFSYCTVPVKIK